MVDMRRQPEVYHRQYNLLNVQEVQKEVKIVVVVVVLVEVITDQIYIHTVPVAVVQLHVHMLALAPLATMVDDDNRT